MVQRKSIAALDVADMVYRFLPGSDAEQVGVGTYPKHEDAPRFRDSICKPNEYSGVYVLRGRGRYRDETGVDVAVEAGTFVHRFPGVRHWLIPEPESGWLEFFIVFPARFWEVLSSSFPGEVSGLPWQAGLQPGLVETMVDLRRRLRVAEDTSLVRIILQMQELLVSLWESAYGVWLSPEGKNSEPDGEDHRVLEACRILREDVGCRLTLEEVAAGFGFPYETFRRWFRQKTGQSPGAYRNRARLEQACALLLQSRQPLAVIARQLGYLDAYAFSRQFRNCFGISPGAYRKSAQ